MIVPRLYYVCESEFCDDGTTVGSGATLKDLKYKMEPLVEDVPFLWAQALYLIARITSKCVNINFALVSLHSSVY